MGQRQGKFPPKHIFFKNLLGWSFPNGKMTSAQSGFPRPDAFSSKT